jgi:hypothetical protein
VSLLNSIDRDHVLTAMETWDAAGGANYMLVRGGVSTHVLLHHGDDSPPAPQRVPGTRSTTPRTPRATTTRATTSRPRVAASDRVDKLCPTCFLALPATGICDNCA